jgi:arylsulfatase A-like enzyme
MFRVPEGTPGLPEGTVAGGRADRVVSLLDIFPTLLDLSGVPPKEGTDGRSLVPLLENPEAEWDYPAITTYDFAEYSVRTERWRYIRYIDDSEELYDHQSDPEEWTNLADDPNYEEIKEELAAYIPKDPHPFVDTSYEIMPHHFPPFRTKEEYRLKR